MNIALAVISIAALVLLLTGATIGVGLLPITVPSLSNHRNLITFFSLGIILGTAFFIAIPEALKGMIDNFETSSWKVTHYFGYALFAGFITMYFAGRVQNSIYFTRDTNDPEKSYLQSVITSSVTVGLTLHAAIDGIALGVSLKSILQKEALGPIFYMAVIIHKLPAAFSLTSLLMKNGIEKKLIWFHLCFFSLATPLGSLFTLAYLLVVKLKSERVTLVLLAFSGGTFLYVVSSAILDINTKEASQYEEGQKSPNLTKLNLIESLIAVGGVMIPLVVDLIF